MVMGVDLISCCATDLIRGVTGPIALDDEPFEEFNWPDSQDAAHASHRDMVTRCLGRETRDEYDAEENYLARKLTFLNYAR